jgi:hypothetical protein
MPVKVCCATTHVAQETSMPQPNHCHPDLFALDDSLVPLAEAERKKLLPLVSALLAETLAVTLAMEASDDEDHA